MTDDRLEHLARAQRWMGLTIVFVFVVLIFSVYWQSYQGRVRVINAQRLACALSLFDRVDGIEVDRDLEGFMLSAAAARVADGKLGRAADYRRRARHAADRAGRRASRLLGADLTILARRGPDGRPTMAAQAEAARRCAATFPAASPWPWAQ